MLKYWQPDTTITFAEFPDEIALCVNITNCPGMCLNCSEPWLLEDKGTLLTENEIDRLISEHKDITVFALMGGDRDHEDIVRIADYIHSKYNLKVGMYSGKDYLDMKLLSCLDIYKIGRWIMPEGDVKDWHKTNNGVLQFPWSNQLYFERLGDLWINTTYKFRKNPLGDLTTYIIKQSGE